MNNEPLAINQKNLLNELKKIYPDYTLRDFSIRSQIQLTRIFRIFNGAELKVSEYNQLQSLIRRNTENSSQKQLFLNLVEDAFTHLDQKIIHQYFNNLRMQLSFHQMLKGE